MAKKNPYGRRGSPAHRHRIGQVEEKLTSNGWQTVAGEIYYQNVNMVAIFQTW